MSKTNCTLVLPGVLLTVFEPTGRPIGGAIGGAGSKGACWKLTRAARYLVLEAEGCLLLVLGKLKGG